MKPVPPDKKRIKLRETDLYRPVRDFLVAQGFTVRAEVHRCDIAGRRGDELVIVELKTALTLELLVQAVKRQRLSDSVYLAVPQAETSALDRKLRKILPVVRRLELGLLFVDLRLKTPLVTVAVQPAQARRRREPKARRALLAELDARTGDDNLGGSTRRPLVTVYRETALHIASALERCGPLAPRKLRAFGTGPKTLSILSSDVYGWFERVDRALYRLRPAGVEALKTYADVVARLQARFSPSKDVAP